jgi:hypothetical protein
MLPNLVLAPQWPVGLFRVRPGLFIFFSLAFIQISSARSWCSWNHHHRPGYMAPLSAHHQVKGLVRGCHHRAIFLWPSVLRDLGVDLTHLRKDLLFTLSNHRVCIIRFSVNCCREMLV